MAVGGEGPKLMTAVFETVTQGWHPFVAPNSPQFQPSGDQMLFVGGQLWELLDGLRWHDGVLQRRQSLIDYVGDQPGVGYSEFGPLLEIPWYIFQTLRGVASIVGGGREVITILVTSRDIWKHDGTGGWVRLTPTYGNNVGATTEGTVSVAAASTAVTGIGTMFVTYGIQPGNQIQFGAGGPVHMITSVNADAGAGALTISPAAAGAFGPAPYSVIRSFGGAFFSGGGAATVFARVFNGDLYVAGSSTAGDNTPAVIIVRDVLSATVAGNFFGVSLGTLTNYLLANLELELPMNVNGSVPSFSTGDVINAINGLELMQSGHVLVLTEENIDRISRLRYSDPTLQLDWVSIPGSFIDIVAGGIRMCTAIERFGRVFAIHYHDSIVLAQPTGQAAPPVSLDSTRCEIGTAYPRSVKNVGGRQFFVGEDGIVYAFNGSTVEMISDEWQDRALFEQPFSFTQMLVGAWIDSFRGEYQFSAGSFVELSIGFTAPPQERVGAVSYRDDARRREIYPFKTPPPSATRTPVCATDDYLGPTTTTGTPTFATGSRRQASHIAGITTTHPGAGVAGEPMLRLLQEFARLDTGGGFFEDPQVRMRTLPLDFGLPGVDKVISSVELWMRRQVDAVDPTATDSITVSLIRGQGETISESSSGTVTYDASERITIAVFDFSAVAASEQWKIQVQPSGANGSFNGQIEKMLVRFQTIGESEAVVGPEVDFVP